MNSSSSAVASPSSPSPPMSIIPLQKYDVFISFRGPDTRNDFTSHLHAALCRKQIYTFIDNGLPKGDPISTLFPIIESSKFSVIIFSQNYASSKWCLNELVKILECRKTRGQRVIPVFYNVNPLDVKNQTGSYAESFAKEHDGKQTPETIQIWRNALQEASRLVGWNTADTRPDALLTQKIAEDIWKKLNHMFSSCNKDLVGIDPRIDEIESMLSLGSMDLCVVGIYGIGGIGKTTLARATMDKILIEFQGVYFIGNIREKSKRADGLSSLRKELFSTLFGATGKMGYVSNFMLARFCRKKVIIVFDDVSDPMQVEEIVGPLQYWDNTGSRFIVTSRDKQVLQYLCDKEKIYKLSGLFDHEALQLFNQYAFKQEFLMTKHIYLLIKKVVEYIRGVPLAIKVLASYLCGRSTREWESALEKLEEIPHVKIQDVLKISYDGLEESQKKLFLDIACFFQEESRDFLVKYFTGCGFKAEIELAILVDRCLIESFLDCDIITMHDMIRRMGREIVRQESYNDPSKRSRLWYHEDIQRVFRGNMGTEAIEGISLDMSMIGDMNLENNAFEKMKNLRFFKFYWRDGERAINKLHFPHGLDSILNELRYLRWDGFPLRSLQPNFILEKLVELQIHDSNILQLRGGVQPLFNLRTMSLTRCDKLTAIPDLSQAQNPHSHTASHTAIEELPSSIWKLKSFEFLHVSNNERLTRLPNNIGDLKSLQELAISHTAIEELPSSIGKLKSLEFLHVSNNERLARLPHNIEDLKSLLELYASHPAIEELPSSVGHLIGLIKSNAVEYHKRNMLDAAERLGSGSTVVNVIHEYNPFNVKSDARSSSQQGNPNRVTDYEMPDIIVDQDGSDEQMISRHNETTPDFAGGPESLLRSEIQQKGDKKRTGISKWLGKSQTSSLTSPSKFSKITELEEIIKTQGLQLIEQISSISQELAEAHRRSDEQAQRTQKQLTRTQEQLTRQEEQISSISQELAEAHRRSDEQAQRTQEQLTRIEEQISSISQELAEAHRRSDEQAQMILNTNSTCQWMADLMRRHYGNDPPPPPPPPSPSTGSGSAMIS